jgi:hypothetical protein
MKGVVMKSKNLFWGLFFLALAVFTIASQVGAFGEIGVLSVLEGVLLAALIIYSLISLNFFGVFIPLAFLYIIFRQPLGLPEVSTWMLLLTGLLTSIGFSIIFHKKNKYKSKCDYEGHDCSQTSETIDDNNPSAKVRFSSSSKYLHSDNLESANFAASFGALEVFFDKTQLSPQGAEVFLDCSFAEIKLYIPRNWRVIENINVSLAEVKYNNRMAVIEENAPRLTLKGNVQFGGIEIVYI